MRGVRERRREEGLVAHGLDKIVAQPMELCLFFRELPSGVSEPFDSGGATPDDELSRL